MDEFIRRHADFLFVEGGRVLWSEKSDRKLARRKVRRAMKREVEGEMRQYQAAEE